MTRKPIPSPEGRFVGFGGIAALLVAAPAFVGILFTGRWWVTVSAIPLVLYMLYSGYGILLLLLAWNRQRHDNIRGLLIYSNSPNWQAYVEEHWIPKLGNQVAVLNWSERATWPKSLDVRIFWYFGHQDENFNPIVIGFRGLRYPLIFRFYHAFRDAKHGRAESLHDLEQEMFALFASSR